MYSGRSYRNSNISIGCIITLVAGSCLVIDSYVIGKSDFFLLLNGNLGKWADILFSAWTRLGDGIIWVPLFLAVMVYRRRFLPLLMAAIVFSTLFTQLTKQYVFPAAPRPSAVISINRIHTVPGVELHTLYSFPSGHTATAFTIYLLACLLINKRWIIPVGFLFALMVGYSRIYLAQHFPLDVGGGMFAAVLSIWLSIFIQERWEELYGKGNQGTAT